VIVLACHNRPADDFVAPCVQSARQWMPEERILVVDSASPDPSYIPKVRALGAEVAEVENRHYETGAWWHAYYGWPAEDFFYFLHDSTLVQGDLTPYRETPLTVVGHMATWNGCDQPHIDRIHALIGQTDYTVPAAFTAVFGSMFFCRREVLDLLAAKRGSQALPNNKLDSECMERVWGIMLGAEGYDLVHHAMRQGEMSLAEDSYPIRKFYGRRT
jgi:hypothetical protein